MKDRRLDWVPAGWLVGVVAVAGVLALAVVIAGRFDLVVFTAPLFGALAGAWWGVRPNRMLELTVEQSVQRTFEGESVTLHVELTAPPGVELQRVEMQTSYQLESSLVGLTRPTPNRVRGEWRLEAGHWGRAWVRARITARGAGGLLNGSALCQVTEVAVFPHADRIGVAPFPKDPPDLLGVHIGRRKGGGVEFAGLREYTAGDSLRSVNWPVSARRGRLHVTERLTEQAAKLVVLVDASGEIRQPGRTTLELSVQGALAVVAAALRRGDRAGVIALGGMMRWLQPGMGHRHFYRIVEALLDVEPGAGSAPADAEAFPPSILPRGAALVVFTPLLDERVVHSLIDLRRRGFGLAVVDVLRARPQPRPRQEYDPLAVRMWRIGRAGVHNRLVEAGIPVAEWAEGAELEEVLRPITTRALSGSRL